MPGRLLDRIGQQSDVMMAVGVIGLIGMMIIPLPPLLLDVLLTINLALALCILMVGMYIREPLDFSVFPSLLLVATLYRLALNISTTRLILLNGHGGRVIEAFGGFVVGGDLIVGLIIFLILVAIQFVVITNGAGRVAEVAARFTLDEMPGKQMAIDADLNAGLVTDAEARQRRRRIEMEADFYGAMDGATKFVRGDAIAALIIVAVNLIGGLIIGVLRLQLPLGEAVQRYCLLTVGDGLVSQLPALLISTATGLIVTRSVSEHDLGHEVTGQILAQPRAVLIAAGMLLVMGLVPGLPKLSFFLIGSLAGLIGWYLLKQSSVPQSADAVPGSPPRDTPSAEQPENLQELLHTDRLRIELGYELLGLADPASGDLPQRVKGVRRQAAERWGVLLPSVRIRDNLNLAPREYALKLREVRAGGGELHPRLLLALKSQPEAPPLEGLCGHDPVFGMESYWIESNLRAVAEARGYTVVEPSTVIATHLAEVISQRAGELLTRQDVHELIERLRQSEPAVVNDLIPDLASLGDVQQVLRALLAERIPVRDLALILEALGDGLRMTQKLDQAVELVRLALAENLCAQYQDENRVLYALTLDPSLEERLQQAGPDSVPAWPPALLEELLGRLEQARREAVAQGHEPILLTGPGSRRQVRAAVAQRLPEMPVLSHLEIVPGVSVKSVAVVHLPVAELAA